MIVLNCPVCGEHVEATDEEAGQLISCQNCGESCRVPQPQKPKPVAAPKPVAQSGTYKTEQVYYNQAGVRITTTRAVFGGQVYAVNGMTSVRMARINPDRTVPVLLMLLGLPFLGCCGPLSFASLREGEVVEHTVFGVFAILAGFALVIFGVWLFRAQKPRYAVVVRTAGGEVRAHISRNPQAIERIVEALSQAFADRG